MRFITVIIAILLSSSLQAQSSEIIQFNNGEIADADDVNSNFNNLDKRVQALEADNTVSTSCSQSDLDGRWSIFLHYPLEERSYLCDAYINEFQNSENSCERFDGLDSQGVNYPYAEFAVKSNCQVNLSVRGDYPESNEVTTEGYLILTSDHRGLMGFFRDIEENSFSTVHAIKLD
jgi:hypothetical protein